jgi:pantothenate synthetase
VDYIAVVKEETLEPASSPGPGLRAIGAATIEGVRLIDNVPIG